MSNVRFFYSLCWVSRPVFIFLSYGVILLEVQTCWTILGHVLSCVNQERPRVSGLQPHVGWVGGWVDGLLRKICCYPFVLYGLYLDYYPRSDTIDFLVTQR